MSPRYVRPVPHSSESLCIAWSVAREGIIISALLCFNLLHTHVFICLYGYLYNTRGLLQYPAARENLFFVFVTMHETTARSATRPSLRASSGGGEFQR